MSTHNIFSHTVSNGNRLRFSTSNRYARKLVIFIFALAILIHVPLEVIFISSSELSYSSASIGIISALSRTITGVSVPVQDLLLGPVGEIEDKKEKDEKIKYFRDCYQFIEPTIYNRLKDKEDSEILVNLDTLEKYGNKSFSKNNGNNEKELRNIKNISNKANKVFIGLQTAILFSCLFCFIFSIVSERSIFSIKAVENFYAAADGADVSGDDSSLSKGLGWRCIMGGYALYWQASGFLVSLGFLGTFVGLLTATWAFPAPEVLKALVNSSVTPDRVTLDCWSHELVLELGPQASAVRTAFATSVVGLAFAILVRVMHAIHDRYAPEDHQATGRRHRAVEQAAQKIADSFAHVIGTAVPPSSPPGASPAPSGPPPPGPAASGAGSELEARLNQSIAGLEGALGTWSRLESSVETQYERRVEELQAQRLLGQQVQELHRNTMEVVKAHNRSASEVREAVAALRQCIGQVNQLISQLGDNFSNIIGQFRGTGRRDERPNSDNNL